MKYFLKRSCRGVFCVIILFYGILIPGHGIWPTGSHGKPLSKYQTQKSHTECANHSGVFMQSLMIPISELKSYARIVTKQNPEITVRRTDILNCIVQTLGFSDYSQYERLMNKSTSKISFTNDTKFLVPEELTLSQLLDWGWRIADDLKDKTGLEIPLFHVLNSKIPSTPLDSSINIQFKHLAELPALRMSGILYLLSLSSGHDFFNKDTGIVNWPSLLTFLRLGSSHMAINLRLYRFHALNQEKGLRYHEGLLADVQKRLIRRSITDEEAIELIRTVLDEEKTYLAGFSGKVAKFTFPLYEDCPISEHGLKNFAVIRSKTSPQKPLLLGLEKNTHGVLGLLAPRKALTLSTEDIRTNLHIAGAAGSGRSYKMLFLLRQAVMNRSGVLYIDGRGDQKTFWFIKSLLKSHGRENDLIFLSINHTTELSKLSLPDLARQNKIVYVMLPDLEKDPEAMRPSVVDILDTLLISLSDVDAPKKSGNFPYCLFLNDIMSVFRSTTNTGNLCSLIDKANQHKIAVVSSEQDYLDYGDLRTQLLSRFKTHLLMKIECLNGGLLELSPKERRDMAFWEPGDFRYFRYDGKRYPKTYRIPYADPTLIKHSYLTMS
jgi:hypothetical protein